MKIKRTKKGTFKLTLKPEKVLSSDPKLKDQNSMYLFDQGYTIGFRKDRKLFKFVGLRNGYEKQLELTLSSILIDRKQYISSKDKYFESVINDNNVIKHDINNISLENRINKSNFKNMVIVNEKFNSLEIVYEVHLKGMDIRNKLKINDFVKNKNNQFIIGDDYNDEQFVIEKPIAYDSKRNTLHILKHNLYYDNNKLYYRKTILNNQIEDNYPIYVDINISFQPYSYGIVYKAEAKQPTTPNWQNLLRV